MAQEEVFEAECHRRVDKWEEDLFHCAKEQTGGNRNIFKSLQAAAGVCSDGPMAAE